MNSDSVKCAVCGAAMRRSTVVTGKLARLRRYKCTCGHCQDVLESDEPSQAKADGEVLIEGFQEIA